MADPERRTWNDALSALRDAGNGLVSALRGMGGSDKTREQLEQDIARFDRSIDALAAKLEQEIAARRTTIETSIDKEQATDSAAKLRSSLRELSGQAQRLTTELADAAAGTMKEVEPEMNAAIRDLDGVIAAASGWLRASIDPTRESGSTRATSGRPPLDDL